MPRPEVEEGRVLVEVKATSVNPAEWHFVTGTPAIARPTMGFSSPRDPKVGSDYSGVVIEVGPGIEGLEPGDEVFGAAPGAFAEVVAARHDLAVRKPPNVSHEQAASAGIAGLTALQALRDHGKVATGNRVLINGASGGVGTFAVQIAKALGAEVVAVCSERNVDLVRSLGADSVIDYTNSDYLASGEIVDVMVDNVGNHPFSSNRHLLRADGIYVAVSGPKDGLLDPIPRMLRNALRSLFTSQKATVFVAKNVGSDFEYLARLMAEGQLVPHIEEIYPFERLPDALSRVGEGHLRSKIAVSV